MLIMPELLNHINESHMGMMGILAQGLTAIYREQGRAFTIKSSDDFLGAEIISIPVIFFGPAELKRLK